MASTFTASLRLNLQATGDSLNVWGQILNGQAVTPLEQAIAGITTLTVNAPVTLTTNNGVPDQARSMMLNLSGTGGVVTIPTATKLYLVINTGTGAMVITTGGGATASIPAGASDLVMCDGTQVYRVSVDAVDLASTLAAAKAYTDAAAFSSASGTLPGQAGNGGKFLSTNGVTPSWLSVPQLASVQTWSAAQTFSGGLSGTLTGSLIGNASSATTAASAATAGSATTAGSANTANSATTAATATFATTAGSATAATTATSAVSATTATTAGAGLSGFQISGLTAMRIGVGSSGNAGLVTISTSVPTSLSPGQIVLVVSTT
jgi:hypothetical protein